MACRPDLIAPPPFHCVPHLGLVVYRVRFGKLEDPFFEGVAGQPFPMPRRADRSCTERGGRGPNDTRPEDFGKMNCAWLSSQLVLGGCGVKGWHD